MTPKRLTQASDGDRLDDIGCRTLRRGLQLLEALRVVGWEGLRVVDMCRATGLERAPVYRLLYTLVETGYVQKLGRFQYALSAKMSMPTGDLSRHVIGMRLQPVLEQVSERLGDATFAIVRDMHISHCIARQLGRHPVQVLPVSLGYKQPLGVGSAGLALLAALPSDEVERVIGQSQSELHHYGGMTAERLRILVRATRERGWSVVANHATHGVLGVGVAVHSRRGLPLAAVSVATTVERMPKERQKLAAVTMHQVLNKVLPQGL